MKRFPNQIIHSGNRNCISTYLVLHFYNFPYTFGYLFALGVYAQKDALGDNFYDKYIDLLKDTGSMPSEKLPKKHLGVDIEEEKQFWLDSISIVNKQMEDFEKLINEATQ